MLLRPPQYRTNWGEQVQIPPAVKKGSVGGQGVFPVGFPPEVVVVAHGRSRIMARLFRIPGPYVRDVARVGHERFAMLIIEMKSHLTYLLFPMAPEFDNRDECGSGFGGALLRSLAHMPRETTTCFLRDWNRDRFGWCSD
ncbi:hypothetical protein R6Q59_002359 [Mikania micrantha]